MRLGVEKHVPLHARRSGDFNLQRVFAAHREEAREAHAKLFFLGVHEVRVVILACGFEFAAFQADQGGVSPLAVRCQADFPL